MTSTGTSFGAALRPGFGGKAITVLGSAGVWLNPHVGLGGDVSFATAFDAQQTEGGFGNCCSDLFSRHRLTVWSAVIKVGVVNRFAVLTGPSSMRIGTTATRVHRPLGDPVPQPPVTTTSATTLFAWMFGGEASAPISERVHIVPAMRVFRRLGEEPTAGDAQGMGGWTTRVTVSVQISGRR